VNQRQGAGTGRWANQREATLEPKTVEGELRQLDDQVRRWGRVDKEQVRTLLKLVAKEGIQHVVSIAIKQSQQFSSFLRSISLKNFFLNSSCSFSLFNNIEYWGTTQLLDERPV